MNNFLKKLFGFHTDDDPKPSAAFPNTDDIKFQDNFSPNKWSTINDMDEAEDNLSDFEPKMSGFGISIFNDPFEINKVIDDLMSDMQRSMRFFGFFDYPSVSWQEEKNELEPHKNHYNYQDESANNSGSLRNSYLKSPGSSLSGNKRDIDLDGKVKVEDVEKILNNSSNNKLSNEPDSVNSFSSPKIYSQSFYIRTVRHPDGSIETIKKIKDHTGKEETIITRDDSLTSSENLEIANNDDASGISIFKKFFRF